MSFKLPFVTRSNTILLLSNDFIYSLDRSTPLVSTFLLYVNIALVNVYFPRLWHLYSPSTNRPLKTTKTSFTEWLLKWPLVSLAKLTNAIRSHLSLVKVVRKLSVTCTPIYFPDCHCTVKTAVYLPTMQPPPVWMCRRIAAALVHNAIKTKCDWELPSLRQILEGITSSPFIIPFLRAFFHLYANSFTINV